MGELANVLQSFPFLSVMNWDKLNLLKLRRLKEQTGVRVGRGEGTGS